MNKVITITRGMVGFNIQFDKKPGSLYMPADPRSWDFTKPPKFSELAILSNVEKQCVANIWPFVRDNSPFGDLKIKKWIIINICKTIMGDYSDKSVAI